MHIVYILQSQKDGSHYIGSTSNLEKRVQRHNNRGNTSTRHRRPWLLVYIEKFSLKENAYRREMQLKRYHGSISLKNIIDNWGK